MPIVEFSCFAIVQTQLPELAKGAQLLPGKEHAAAYEGGNLP
jgi:hypothetical protein